MKSMEEVVDGIARMLQNAIPIPGVRAYTYSQLERKIHYISITVRGMKEAELTITIFHTGVVTLRRRDTKTQYTHTPVFNIADPTMLEQLTKLAQGYYDDQSSRF